MFIDFCQRIRTLTIQSDEFIDNNEIELCLALLVERQYLLEQLKNLVSGDRINNEQLSAFTSLLVWIQQQDIISNLKVVQLKEQSKQASTTQVKIKKALNYYKNVT